MDRRLLSIIVCPVCNSKLFLDKEKQELICKVDLLGFPIRNGIPILLEKEARRISYY
ncbi:Trm112 family protein [Blochmannia endosymbiont of Colobopsis nipponica]|uniref:Trm112 family protein n=1 Tax=Blochmannia endosymbiont of Colobopsis nipponica TaxID=2681987 RepID=UPI0017830FB6|nr:Trm112 family protein [Blochmannia endosymbiont of Colobopsis nipponica]QOI11071.1 Trm112 family protein [Blochmannia endosymbiont of Colobopsis nipponica]